MKSVAMNLIVIILDIVIERSNANGKKIETMDAEGKKWAEG